MLQGLASQAGRSSISFMHTLTGHSQFNGRLRLGLLPLRSVLLSPNQGGSDFVRVYESTPPNRPRTQSMRAAILTHAPLFEINQLLKQNAFVLAESLS